MKIINKFKGNARLALLLLFGVFLIGLVISIRWLSGGDGLSSGGAVAVVPLLGPITDEDQFIENLKTDAPRAVFYLDTLHVHRNTSRIGDPRAEECQKSLYLPYCMS